MSAKIPHATEPLLDGGGRLSRSWFTYLSSLSASEASAALQEQIDRLWQEFKNLPDSGLSKGTQIVGSETINVNGTLASGRVVLSLTELPDSGGGALKKILRDDYGRVAGTSDPTTTDLPEGANLYYTDARVDARIAAAGGIQVGEVLVADGISPPEMLTDEAETDFLYQG